MRLACAVALVGLLALSSPVADARRLLQSSATTDADILNFALNLEVRCTCDVCLCTCDVPFVEKLLLSHRQVSMLLTHSILSRSVWRLSTTPVLCLAMLSQMSSQAAVLSLLVASKPTSPTMTFTALQWT